jgi:Zn ribbon nucleic-acid-binding protein
VVELGDIFRLYGSQYRAKYGDKMPPSHRRAMRDIERCRTAEMGGHVYTCPECAESQYLYHSCRNRHCPKCQNDKAQQWLESQQDLLLPVDYFLLTFTLPDELRDVARSHQKLVYHLLFQASAAAAQQLAQAPRFVGGQLGMVGVLHTWGRNLCYHPHVHYLVAGGGLACDGQALRSNSGQAWLPARKNFLFPVKALSRIFRAKFRDGLRQADCFADVPAEVWEKDWVVHCQPVGNGLTALKYLAPYIFRVAISNNRILKLEDGRVTFRYRASDTGKLRTCTLPALEFIRRFLQHVLPRAFVKVRYYGFLAPGCRQRLAALRQQLGRIAADPPSAAEADDAQVWPASSISSNHVVLCPSCGHVMQRRSIIRPRGRCPP